MPSSRRRSRRPRPSEDGILDAAERLFAERGYGGTSLRDLLTASGCSTTAFYARFPDTGAVLEALAGRIFEDVAQRAAEVLPTARSLEDGYAQGLRVLLDVVRERRGLVAVVLGEGAAVPAVRERTRTAYRALAALLAAAFGDRVASPEPLAWALVGAIDLQLRRWAVLGDLDEAGLESALVATTAVLLPSEVRRATAGHVERGGEG